MITQYELKALLDYCPETGAFTWRTRTRDHFTCGTTCAKWNTRYAGKPAGSYRADGYLILRVHNVAYYAHRLAYLWMQGEYPIEVDHANCNPSDNRWANLRNARRCDNTRNMRKPCSNTSGEKGVWLNRRTGKWVAGICIENRLKHLGYFHDFDEAKQVVRKAREDHFGEFARHD